MVSLTASGEGYIGGYEMVGLLPPPSSLLPQHVILIPLGNPRFPEASADVNSRDCRVNWTQVAPS